MAELYYEERISFFPDKTRFERETMSVVVVNEGNIIHFNISFAL